jgi:hypothetical protein
MRTKTVTWVGCLLCAVLGFVFLGTPAHVAGKDDSGYYTEPQMFDSRPPVNGEMHFGHIGVTGLQVRVYKGVTIKVEGTEPNTPAHNKFKVGEIITGINGISLKGRNAFVTLGNALTKAEATDGKMIFDVQSEDGTASKKVEVVIPVLGSYSKTWPLNCEKSKKIIAQAAEFYADKEKFNQGGIGGAMACLFLLSTGDDKYLPRVKEYFAPFVSNPNGIGDHSWDNGYNGIACAEYYLRTGDSSVMPVLQYFCDNAKERQMFGCSWTHWGRGISPGYVAGGLMNPAATQILTSLLMAKECGAVVDETTLLGSLRFFYRFAGRGTVPYGDHRGEGGLGSNGKDGMIAAAMQIASGAQGDVSIYTKAKKYLSMSMLTSYPVLVRGHGDEGRGDALWRGITSSYLMDEKPAMYREAMDRLTWWHDLSRRPGGGIGVATCQSFDDVGSGTGVALAYTAPLKTLRITGAPRSKYAKDFKLPEHLWGRAADLTFLNIENSPEYNKYGKPEPTHIPFYKLGGAYHNPSDDLKTVPKDEILKNVFHKRYMIRVQAAKALRIIGALDELEKLMTNRDPRVRRAALDGIIDYNYWFSMGGDAVKTEAYTENMLTAIKKMLSDPTEALYVVDGALFAMHNAPVKAISENIKLIMPWTTHEDWWLRESSFMALSGLERDDAEYLKILPTLVTMMVNEYPTMPRDRMTDRLQNVLRRKKPDSEIGKLILAGMLRAAEESKIIPGIRSAEGAYNAIGAANVCLVQAPETSVQVAKIMQSRFDVLGTEQIIQLAATPNSNREGRPYGLYTTLEKLSPDQRTELTDILFNGYRGELVKRMKATGSEDQVLIDTIIDLTKLKKPVAGWNAIGEPKPEDRQWRFISFDPQEKDKMHPREKRRFRDVTLPEGLENWYMPDFDDSKWKSGKAPIGKGLFKQGNATFKNNSEWGDGEFILMRTTFDLDALDYDSYRISVLASQGFHIYLNGHKIHTYIWWKDMPHYRLIMLGPGEIRHLKQGANVLAIYSNIEYPRDVALGQVDLYLEGLKKKDLE